MIGGLQRIGPVGMNNLDSKRRERLPQVVIVACSFCLPATVLLVGCSSNNATGSPASRTMETAPAEPLVGQTSFLGGDLLPELAVVGNDVCLPPKTPAGYSYWRWPGQQVPWQIQEQIKPGTWLPMPQTGEMGFQPGVNIHLRFSNHSPVRLVFRIEGFRSTLGNFAIQPSQLSLDPGQSAEVEPMNSSIGDSSVGTIVTLILKIAGNTEQKVITLQTLSAAGDSKPDHPD